MISESLSPTERGRRIAEARKTKGMTQERLAELSGTSRSLVQRMEKGDFNLKIELMRCMAKALDIPLEDII